MIHLSRPDKDGNPQGNTICGKRNGPDVKWRKSCVPNCPDCVRINNGGAGLRTPQKGRQRA